MSAAVREAFASLKSGFGGSSTPVQALTVVGPLAAIAAVAVGAVAILGSGASEPPLDAGSETYATDLVANLGAEPAEVAADLVDRLLGENATPAEQQGVLGALAQILAGPDGEGSSADAASEVILNGLIRRLGVDAADVGSSDEMIALLIAEIDPDGTIDSPEELIAAVEAWAAQNAANVLRIVAPELADAGPLLGIGSANYEDMAALLEGYRATADVLDLPLAGIAGLEPLTVPGVEWALDDRTRSLVFTGETTLFDQPVELLLIAHWGTGDSPSLSVGLRTAGWSLDGFGVDGPIGDYLFPNLTFVLAGDDVRLPLAAIPDSVAAFFTADFAGDPEALTFDSGLNLLTTLPLDTLPAAALSQLGLRADNSLVGLRGVLGADFAIMSGGPVAEPTGLLLEATLPPIEPPSFPDWLSQPDDARWALALGYTGTEFSFGLSGALEARIDGEPRPFAVRFDLASDGSGEASGMLRGELTEPWVAPFGVDWLTFDQLAMELSLDSSNATALFTAELTIADRDATLSFELSNGESGGAIDLTATLDRLTAEDVVTFIADRLDATPPSAVPDLALEQIVLSIRTGPSSSIAVAATADVAGQQADILLSTISEASAKPAVLIGVQLDEWGLAEAFPELEGTLLEEIRFPPAALVLSTLEAELEADELTAPVRQFFGRVAASGADDFTLELRPGLSMFGSLSFAGTDLEAPMEALGFAGANFPVVGTLPGSLIGLGGSPGGSALDDLALSVALPSIAPPGAPEWFVEGKVSFEITGRPSLTLQGEMTVLIEDDELSFIVGSQFARVGPGITVSLFGALEADEPWEAPLGIEWLTLNRVAVELSISAAGSVGVGFAGSMIIGEKDIDVAVKLEINAVTGVPTNLLLAGASDEGVSTGDLIALQRQIAQAASPNTRPLGLANDQPELAIRNLEFRFAPKASPVLEVEAGFVLAGDAFIAFEAGGPETRFGFIDFRITADGLFALGQLTAYDLGPIAWDDINLDVEISLADQHFIFDGGAEIFGAETQVAINISTRSIFFAGQQALADLKLIVDAFEIFLNDPIGSLDQLPLLFRELGVPQPQWVTDLVAILQDLADQGQTASTAALDIVLNGGTVPLIAFPIGGDSRVCSILTPFEVNGRCYTTPPIVSANGVPAGGNTLTCSILTPQLHTDGRCYTTKPSGTTVETCPLLQPLKSGGRCYSIIPTFLDSNGTPNGGVAPNRSTITIPGIPSGGTPRTACSPISPIKVGSRCYTIPPGDLVPGIPEGGNPLICGIFVNTFEGGLCWTVSPSQAAVGLPLPGLCTAYPEISCSWEQLTSQDLRPLLLTGLTRRLSDW